MEKNKIEQLEKLHKLELKIALELKKICDKHQIKYFLIAGTMLGAVRHGGFIPWDDDMDIGMLREDYEKFIMVCKKELSEEYFLQTWNSDSEYAFSYAKIRINNTRIIEKFSENSNAHSGIFIDIFPFDNVPDNKIKRKVQCKEIYILRRLLCIKKGYGKEYFTSAQDKFKYEILKCISNLFSFKYLKEKLCKTLTKYNRVSSECVFTDGSYGYDKETIKREWVTNLSTINFEGEEFLAINEYRDYLSYFYGEYMILPPVDKRGGHEIIDINFGIY
ncbi:LicD family protein [Romboutsia sp.]|uniref:LicD family protein n=1 Tax=Romboutsia sp. TaxID=1965302 RepID=UPI003F3C7C10